MKIPGATTTWVNCPVCDSPDMECQTFREGGEDFKLIFCVNHACASNGGTNHDGLNKVSVNPRSPYECYWSRRALAAEKREQEWKDIARAS